MNYSHLTCNLPCYSTDCVIWNHLSVSKNSFDKLLDVIRQELWLFKRLEMSPSGHLCVLHQISALQFYH